ncbi:N-acetylglucosamine kinase-like BadF-type ATPase [Propionibacteriaceae bacterium ES.041]|uniref:ATPase BadF/BadG/BcrA/BcrD type domain-containing protein n=1 Tax=Enemella evansiae TaxID=2016499 RepID=A0A255G6Q7_9ACTN|nr:BadF/BadG/BcrA/BcrD ATPase family protein [Enemella evansiae]OYN95072.1 hypothetical protein CGZ96_16630 [Enemella evansiae]OYN98577.1 hypothetical protein CGZ95_12545 [Enemella evansiae]OYO11555.1 hypothetical protein CGZ94_14060 [Enemella evansiae]PFG66277.1 N-acetylglucosamine kinase-like BadF-type ATPase [Propionibacteriaceae bacterium ES.041]
MNRTSTGCVLGIDVGGTGIRLRGVRRGRETAVEERRAIRRTGSGIDIAALADAITRLARTGAVDLDAHGIRALCVGTTGVPGPIDPDELAEALRQRLGAARIAIAGDALTSHVGALTGEPGVIVAAGTGAIALGTDLAGIWNRVDGWGYLAGDEGSGSWIGRQGLQLALRALDGRSPGSPLLLEFALQQWGDADTLIKELYRAESPAQQLAGFCPAVAQAARRGDEHARAIWTSAGTALGQAAAAASAGLPPVITWAGSMFNAGELLLEPFWSEVRRTLPTAERRAPRGRSVDGALQLAERLVAGTLPVPASGFLHTYG